MLIIEKLPTRYSEGSATVVANEVTVTPTDALWYGNVWGDDRFFLPSQPLVPPQRIETVNEDGTLTLAYPWPGDSATEEPYEIRYVGIIERSTAQTRRVLEQLGEVDAYFDVQVDELSDRDAYDEQPAGYRVLVANNGDGRAAIYSKNSGASGDWSDPAYVTGGSIDVSVGTVTELDYGETPTITGTPGPGTLELDFGLPGGPELSIGSVTRGDADVTSTPVTGGYELDFTIPSQVAQGDYSGATSYVTGDIVQDGGSSWVALQDTTGNAPPTLPTTSNAYWQLLARAGNDGAGTVTSLSGGTGISIDSTDPTIPVISAIIASQTEAEAGTEAAKLMTPERTAQAIAALSQGYDANIALLALEVADLKGGRLGMVGGIADPFDDETGIDAGATAHAVYSSTNDWYSPERSGSEVTINNQSGTSTQGGAVVSQIARNVAVLNAVTVSRIGVYRTTAKNMSVKIAQRNSAGNYTIVVDQAINHSGSGWEDFNLVTPYDVPASGTFYLGASHTSGDFNATASTPRAYINADATGTSGGWGEDTNPTFPLRYTHSAMIEDMTLTSIVYVVETPPSLARLAVQLVESAPITINDDLTAEVSRDGGSTWTAASLALIATGGGVKLYEDSTIDISGQPSDTDMVWRVKTHDGTDVAVSGLIAQWR